jgi:N-acetylglucosaminyl-diphospho-decaprenol L-rhamnosyltransferase
MPKKQMTASTSNRTSIVVLNYRTSDLTMQCLHSLSNEMDSSSTNVVVVDNNSRDGSGKKIQEEIFANEWESWVDLIELNENRGYASGNNAAIRKALASENPPEFIVILNPDTIVQKEAIQALIDFMDKNPNVGIAGSRLENPDGTPQFAAFRFPGILSEFIGCLRLGFITNIFKKWNITHDISLKSHPTDWVAGACFIIRTDVLRDVGLLDENYFLYYEEVDFCLQAHRAGWECWHVPESRIIHFVGQSTGYNTEDPLPKRCPSYWFESRQRFFQKNYGWFYTVMTDLAWMIGFILWRIRRLLQQKPDRDPPHMLWDFFRYSSLLRWL